MAVRKVTSTKKASLTLVDQPVQAVETVVTEVQDTYIDNLKLQKRTLTIRKIVDTAFLDVAREVKAAREDATSYEQWKQWLVNDFGWSEQYGCELVNVAEMVGTTPHVFSKLGSSQLRLIAAPSVPDETRQELVARSQEGETFTVLQTKEMIKQAKEEERARVKQQANEQLAGVTDEYNATLATLTVKVKEAEDALAAQKSPDTAPAKGRMSAEVRRLKTELEQLARQKTDLEKQIQGSAQAVLVGEQKQHFQLGKTALREAVKHWSQVPGLEETVKVLRRLADESTLP